MSVGVKGAEEAVRFVVGAGGEKERLARPSTTVVPEYKAPQPIDDDRSSGGFGQRAKGVAVRWIERIDLAVTEISDQQLAGGHVTEASRRRERHAPGRVERAPRGETVQVVAGKIECVHDAIPRARDIVVPLLILHRKG